MKKPTLIDDAADSMQVINSCSTYSKSARFDAVKEMMRLKESSNVDTNSKDPGSSFEESTSASKVIRENTSLNSDESLL